MRILALETTGRLGSIAALEGQGRAATVLRENRLTGGSPARDLAPELAGMIRDVGWLAESIELFAVVVGPGSFTGLRIGVTTAKTLAYALGAAVIGVDTMDVLAAQAGQSGATLWTIMDAQRQELFAARFTTSADGKFSREPTRIIRQADWLAELRPGDRAIGPPLAHLQSHLPAGVEIVASELWQPQAAFVGQVAWREFQSGRRDDVWQLAPQYLRLSAAEEKAAHLK